MNCGKCSLNKIQKSKLFYKTLLGTKGCHIEGRSLGVWFNESCKVLIVQSARLYTDGCPWGDWAKAYSQKRLEQSSPVCRIYLIQETLASITVSSFMSLWHLGKMLPLWPPESSSEVREQSEWSLRDLPSSKSPWFYGSSYLFSKSWKPQFVVSRS